MAAPKLSSHVYRSSVMCRQSGAAAVLVSAELVPDSSWTYRCVVKSLPQATWIDVDECDTLAEAVGMSLIHAACLQ